MKKNKLDPTIDRDLGTKNECRTMLRAAIALATEALDRGSVHTAIYMLQQSITDVLKKLPREKITKPFKKYP